MEEKRSSVRIDDYISFDYKILSEEEYREEEKRFKKSLSSVEKIDLRYPFFSRIQEKYREKEGEISFGEQLIIDLLISIADKLDYILKIIAPEKIQFHENPCLKKPSLVNISAGGMRFVSEKEIKKDTPLKIRICIPIFPSFVIEVLGRVVWTKKQDSGFVVGVRFTLIHEEDREALIHYIFIKQRKFIKESKS